MVGTPAIPIREWTRQRVTLRRLAMRQSGRDEAEGDDD
jgi:UDP-3-O-[3-hydroxymyristoyl] glucosamine N-acyltransferase